MSAFPDLMGQDVETALGGVREGREKEIVKSFLRLTLRVASLRYLDKSDDLEKAVELAGVDSVPALETEGAAP